MSAFKTIRSLGTFWVAGQSLDHLERIRSYEFDSILDLLPPNGSILEIGAGTGWQARAFAEKGYDVRAIDLSSSNYRKDRVWPIDHYDGKKIPFEDDAFDIVFSSSVLEHIPHINEFQKEIQRVLKPGGCALHIMPSGHWRFWTNITVLLRAWRPARVHGEQAGNILSEIYYFSRRWWTRLFRETGWSIEGFYTNGLFYTGSSIMGSRLSLGTRAKLSRVLGSSCHVFLLRQTNDAISTRAD